MRQAQQQRNATIIQTVTEVETEESIYERLRREALQENEQIRQDWQNRTTEQNNVTTIEDNITQFENQIPEIEQRVRSDFWLTNYNWWHSGSWLQTIFVGSTVTAMFVGGAFIFFRYFRRYNEIFGVRTTQNSSIS